MKLRRNQAPAKWVACYRCQETVPEDDEIVRLRGCLCSRLSFGSTGLSQLEFPENGDCPSAPAELSDRSQLTRGGFFPRRFRGISFFWLTWSSQQWVCVSSDILRAMCPWTMRRRNPLHHSVNIQTHENNCFDTSGNARGSQKNKSVWKKLIGDRWNRLHSSTPNGIRTGTTLKFLFFLSKWSLNRAVICRL